MATDSDLIQALTSALQDSLMVIAPPGWTQVELDLGATASGLRVKALSAKGNGATAPIARAPLNIEPREEAVRLGEGLTELAFLLAEKGKRWDGGKATVARGPQFAEWKLLQADGSPLWFNRLLRSELEGLVFTDALFELLRGTERAVASLQSSFELALGQVSGHEFSPTSQTLTLTRASGVRLTARAQLVGCYTRESFSWVWGWATEEVAPSCAERVKRVCAPEARQPGLAALWKAQLRCDEGFAWALASHLVVAICARGLVRAASPGAPAVAFFALLEDPA